ncbi:MAG: carbohydrate kinase [Oscillospiraceae bacterium]|nr:carbohydrate kinase [Oscillospiraceae bacterium]
MFDFVSIGEILIDFTPCGASEKGAPHYQQNPGGAPANVACVMAKLGRKAAFIGKVGRDSFGYACKKALEDAGCDASHLVFSDKEHTTLAFVTLSPDGDRDFSFYRNHTTADVNLTIDDIPEEIYGDARFFHFGSVSQAQEPSRTTMTEAVKKARAAGAVVSYDPNLRERLWGDLGEAKEIILSSLPLCDMLKISGEEKDFLFGEMDEDLVGEKLNNEYGIPFAVITKGKEGCTAFVQGRRFDSPAYDVKTIDTTGAGDSFWAGIMLTLLEKDKRPEDLTDGEMTEMLRFANALGSLVTTKRGAIAAIPERNEIDALIASGKTL